MGIHTANLEPPKAIVVGSDRARLEPILAALTTAGYTAMALAYDDDLGASALAQAADLAVFAHCLLYTSPSPRDRQKSRMPSSA